MKKIPVTESYLQGHVSCEAADAGLRPWRLPVGDLPLYATHGELVDKAGRTAGVRLRFKTTSPELELEVKVISVHEAAPVFDLVSDGQLLATVPVDLDAGVVRFTGLEPSQVYEIWLPVFSELYLQSFVVPEGASVEPVADERLRWVTYGSSISHCAAATSPALSWPAVAARAHDLQLTNLGYGGNCHLEPMLGRLIRDLPADIITLKLGINVYGRASMNDRTFAAAAIGLVQLVREKHPETPVGLITPIFACHREGTPNASGMTLEQYREQLRLACAALKKLGDEKLFFFEGRELLWEDEADLLPDDLHPNGEGYRRMGQRVAEKIIPVLLQAR
ncbi:SGNH/GDSL hydrolase family protein [Coraliomargarita parva]|uniref:SGNH/GDSL hydrolase family protein n=1 Tax=Coraliomargarita parva TaxID=3014050 RepID=UPI0022B3BF18|nr:SGNH/GDSL hydrolase family protein [Coraliomargarita parva]